MAQRLTAKAPVSRVPRHLGLTSATLVVVASMIGTGVFTTTGLLLAELGSPSAVLLTWAIGGVMALCGALSYAELGAAVARNGGEYRLLSDTFHPAVGFVAGWICLVVGFSAPIAASALAFGKYLHALFPESSPVASGVALVVLLSLAHAMRVKLGARLQNVLALATLVLVVAFIVGAATRVAGHANTPMAWPRVQALLNPHLAVSIIMVSYAYSGWNAAVYLAGEIRDPARNLPIAVGLGTGLVTLLYLGLNAAFLLGAPLQKLIGTVEVGHLVATCLFGPSAGRAVSAMIACALASSCSALMLVGPRVYEAMGHDHEPLRWLQLRPDRGGPYGSIALQGLLAIILLVTFTFDTLLLYVGVTLSISSALTVSTVFIRRREHGKPPFAATGYPVTPLLFLIFVSWLVFRTCTDRPLVFVIAAATIAIGFVLYRVVRHQEQAAKTKL